ncbi:5'-methylthioadenosine/S-adenosylhomocysteine nucleosidase [Actinokineospora enzanensis]|uniref:5'-methylthioadenosine/S-adenosylhomocysteine nucleosidase family protein n=1 Tax=Actinokineospora enzanensis TaxID=155975 RepID=UPI00035F1EC7|nr:5'-methylthioadenosine/S-adenosylhomocysteine nucleosidase [Actinokineospora enzanensis]
MIAILTALQSEYQAVREHLVDVRTDTHPKGTVFEVGTLTGRPGRRVAVTVGGMGNLSAATLTERIITHLRPAAVMFVGIAGGLRDWMELGDVVVATRVYAAYGGRSDTEGFSSRPRAFDAAHGPEQAARGLARGTEWRAGLQGEPAVHFAPIVSGDVVLDARDSEHARHLRQHYNDAVAVEMESAGFAQSVHLNEVAALVVRGISDHAGGDKRATDGKGWQDVAARNAAAFAVAVAAAVEDPSDDADADTQAATEKHPVVHNTASGNSRVGQQFGVVSGGVTITNGGGDR